MSVNLVPLLLTGVRLRIRQGGPTRTSADVSVPRPRTHDDRTGRVFPDHLITYLLLTYLLTYLLARGSSLDRPLIALPCDEWQLQLVPPALQS